MEIPKIINADSSTAEEVKSAVVLASQVQEPEINIAFDSIEREHFK